MTMKKKPFPIHPDMEYVEITREMLDELDAKMAAQAAKERDEQAAKRQAEIAAILATPDPAPIEEPAPDTPAPRTNGWYIFLFTLNIIANILFFIPMLLLTLVGITKHPFLGYFIFRDIMRNS